MKPRKRLIVEKIIQSPSSTSGANPDVLDPLFNVDQIRNLLDVDGVNVTETLTRLDKVGQVNERLQAILVRCRELALEAALESTTLSRRLALQREADQLVDQYNDIVSQTDFSVIRSVQAALDKSNN